MTTDPDLRGALEVRGPAAALLDEPLRLGARGGGPDAKVVWRARVRDDDGRVWRATATTAEGLDAAWAPAKTPAGTHAALQSLRPVRVEVRAELPDGRTATRTVTRILLDGDVRVRRWRGELAAALMLPAGAPTATALVDGTAGDDAVAAAIPAAALLASRGVLVLVVRAGGRRSAAEVIDRSAERLAAVPGATAPHVLGAADGLPLPPGIPGGADLGPRAVAWDALLARLGARPRQAAAGAGSS